MPYFPPIPRPVTMSFSDLSEGNLTLFDDGYWGVETAYIDSISVKTVSTNWNMFLCTDSGFDLNDIRTRKLVSNGLGTAIVSVEETYQSVDGKIYLIFDDLTGSATVSLYVVGRTI